MEKLKIEGINGESQLPEEMIQHIQSFLSGKEACRTSILSKSWHTAWLTRPNLDFSKNDIRMALRFVERYEKLKRNIQSLKLVTDVCELGNISLAKELIVKAMKLGPTDVDIQFFVTTTLPHHLFESKNLLRLSLHNCKIDQTANTFWGMISMCSSIEELKLSRFELRRGRNSKPKPGYDFRNLKVLSLKDMEIDEWLFSEGCIFHCLKELAIQDCNCYEEKQIRSNSLECISFVQTSRSRTLASATFDVPRIRKFKYSGSFFPYHLFFKTCPREGEWESDISITCNSSLSKFTWPLHLMYFLAKLRPSKIFLRLRIGISCHVYGTEGVKWLHSTPPIAVEKFTYESYPLHHSLLDDIFWICRPSFVDLYWSPSCKANNDVSELTLVKENGEKSSMPSLHDLEEVNVEFFDGCTPLPCKTLSDTLAYSGNSNKLKICHKLKWGGGV